MFSWCWRGQAVVMAEVLTVVPSVVARGGRARRRAPLRDWYYRPPIPLFWSSVTTARRFSA